MIRRRVSYLIEATLTGRATTIHPKPTVATEVQRFAFAGVRTLHRRALAQAPSAEASSSRPLALASSYLHALAHVLCRAPTSRSTTENSGHESISFHIPALPSHSIVDFQPNQLQGWIIPSFSLSYSPKAYLQPRSVRRLRRWTGVNEDRITHACMSHILVAYIDSSSMLALCLGRCFCLR